MLMAIEQYIVPAFLFVVVAFLGGIGYVAVTTPDVQPTPIPQLIIQVEPTPAPRTSPNPTAIPTPIVEITPYCKGDEYCLTIHGELVCDSCGAGLCNAASGCVSPTPLGPRWCDAAGCYSGYPPTPAPTPEPTPAPTPEPTPSPTPAPIWRQMGMLCEVPDALAHAKASEAYYFQCACDIRTRMGLGPYITLNEACNAPQYAHDAGCAACINEVCAASSGLC